MTDPRGSVATYACVRSSGDEYAVTREGRVAYARSGRSDLCPVRRRACRRRRLRGAAGALRRGAGSRGSAPARRGRLPGGARAAAARALRRRGDHTLRRARRQGLVVLPEPVDGGGPGGLHIEGELVLTAEERFLADRSPLAREVTTIPRGGPARLPRQTAAGQASSFEAEAAAPRKRTALSQRTSDDSAVVAEVASLCCCKSPRARFPVVVGLGGAHLLGSCLFIVLVSHPGEALAVELVEADAVGLVGDQQVEHGPDEREAALLAGEAAHHLGPPLDFAERALEQVR
jgi:hypothetical protein